MSEHVPQETVEMTELIREALLDISDLGVDEPQVFPGQVTLLDGKVMTLNIIQYDGVEFDVFVQRRET